MGSPEARTERTERRGTKKGPEGNGKRAGDRLKRLRRFSEPVRYMEAGG